MLKTVAFSGLEMQTQKRMKTYTFGSVENKEQGNKCWNNVSNYDEKNGMPCLATNAKETLWKENKCRRTRNRFQCMADKKKKGNRKKKKKKRTKAWIITKISEVKKTMRSSKGINSVCVPAKKNKTRKRLMGENWEKKMNVERKRPATPERWR